MSFWNAVGGALVDWAFSGDNSESSLSTTQGAMNRAASARVYKEERMAPTNFIAGEGKIDPFLSAMMRQASSITGHSISEAGLAAGLLKESLSAKSPSLNVGSAGAASARTKGSLVGRGLGQKEF